MSANTPHLLDLTAEEQESLLQSIGAEPYRLRQIVTWFFGRRVTSFREMTDIPQPVRERLTERLALEALELSHTQVSSQDGTTKYHFSSVRVPHDRVIAVLLPAARTVNGQRASARSFCTACVSTQVGCGYACAFCASGLVKFQRHLLTSEIVQQVLGIEHDRRQRLQGVLFMGMGEPLANYRHVVQAIRWLQAPDGLHLGARHITLSTSGLAPQIKRLAEEGIRVRLAVSLHAAAEALRRKLLPVASTYSIREVLQACRFYAERTGQPTTIEYILLAGVNDGLREAQRLSNLLRRFPGHVNLIPYNPVEGLPFQTPSSDSVARFQTVLRQRGLRVFVRPPKGVDLGAGCGQLGASPADRMLAAPGEKV